MRGLTAKAAALPAVADRVPIRVGILRDECIRPLSRRPDHVAGLRRHGIADFDQVRVTGRDVVAVIAPAGAAREIPRVVDARRHFGAVVVLQHQLSRL